jgi:glycosyltransferase involved in cell wall biosynthesis
MHIIVLEQEPSSRRGGQEVVLLDFCRGLSQRGHSISLVHTTEGNLLKQYQDFCSHVVKVNRLTVYRKPYIFSFLADIFQTNWKIPTSKDSIVLSNQYQDSLFGRTLAISKNLPFVCYLHIPPPKLPPNTFVEWQWNIGLKGVKQFIAVSNQTKLDWVESGFKEDKIEVVYNGIDLEVYKPSREFSLTRKEWNIPEESLVISYVGRLDREKGLEILIKGFALLTKSAPSIRLLIAGKTVLEGEEYKKSLEQLVSDLGIEKDVSFLGHVSNTTSLYQVSDVTVLASRWSEPFPRAIIESMACGTPVVASRTGGIPEFLTGEFQNGLFEPGNERDLADTLSQTMNWRNRDQGLGNRCREHVFSKFTLEKMVDGIEKVLLRVINR